MKQAISNFNKTFSKNYKIRHIASINKSLQHSINHFNHLIENEEDTINWKELKLKSEIIQSQYKLQILQSERLNFNFWDHPAFVVLGFCILCIFGKIHDDYF